MKFKALAAALAFAAVGPSMAATFDLGNMGPPGLAEFGNSFSSVQSFSDTFDFVLNSEASSNGLSGSWDLSLLRNIAIKSVSLSGGTLASTLVDYTPADFSFSNLGAGSYHFVVTGAVTGLNGGLLLGPIGRVGYAGLLSTVAAPVPEPETLVMMVLGLGAVGVAARRRKSTNA